jgi:hypothetical protein
MAGKDIIMIRQRELRRLHIIHKVLEGEITQRKAAELTLLSERQIRRIVKRIREEGDGSIRHRNRGRESNRKTPKGLKERMLKLYQQKYRGFGPTLTAEKLTELDNIQISKETVRTWLIESGDWQKKLKRKKHRQWRQRKHCRGEMVQMDGSQHDWFEGRGPRCVFMGYIDDATGRVFGKFYAYEGTVPAMDSFRRYIREYGLPVSVYLDKHSTYKSWAKPTEEEEIEGRKPMSQFERALKELGVEVIHAHSPQAKGRVERLFGTLQDRLVKEMRLRGISNIEDANGFLIQYLPKYNKRFAVQPMEKVDLHRKLHRGINLNKILCIRTERVVRNDFTVAHNKKLYQIQSLVKAKRLTIEERIDGSMLITYQQAKVRFKEITERPEKQQKLQIKLRRKKPQIISEDHPWRTSQRLLFERQKLRKQLRNVAA